MFPNVKVLGLTAVSALLLTQEVAAKIISISVGEGGLKFSPNSTTAAVGDTLAFSFVASDHNVVQGAFNTPCAPGNITHGFAAPFVNTTVDGTHEVFSVMVNDTNPIWYYCSVTGHCQNGMVGVINPPTSGPNTLDAYAAGAKATNKSVTVSAAGGSLINATSSNSTSSGSGGATSTSSSGSSATSSKAATVTNAAVVGIAMNLGLLGTMGGLAAAAAAFLQ